MPHRPIKIPDGTRLHCWLVSDGSYVSKGESLAIALPNDLVLSINPAQVPKKSQIKRPTKRRRNTTKKPPPRTSTLLDTSPANAAVASVVAKEEQPSEKTKELPPIVAPETTSPKDSVEKKKDAAAASESSIVDPTKGHEVFISAPSAGIVQQNTTENKSPLEIGYIEDCRHPTIVDNMCGVCCMRTEQFGNNKDPATAYPAAATAPSNMSQITFSGATFSVSEDEGKRIAEDEAKRLHSQRKLSLVLDLDHTLVHATADGRAERFHHEPSVRTIVLPVAMPNRPVILNRHFVKLRPHLKEFILGAMEKFELRIYTAGTRDYAEQIIILLARDIVGAKLDQIELEQLRHRVNVLEAEVQSKRKQALKSGAEMTGNEEPKKSGGAEDTETTGNEEPTNKAEDEQDETSPKKRKRVTFDTAEAESNHNAASEALLTELQTELSEAERLEREALDLRQKLFGSRVVTRTDVGDLGSNTKSLKRIFPCGGTMAAVVDDREDVWANAKEIFDVRRGEPPDNLLLVRPYQWKSFQGFPDVNNAPGSIPKGQEESETEKDEQLPWTGRVLSELHGRYYARQDDGITATVPQILTEMRSEILSKCYIVLTHLIPIEKQNPAPGEPRPMYLRYVESLGGTALRDVDSTVTHVVAGDDGTEKIKAARKVRGCHVVGATWLTECFWSFSKRDERRHRNIPRSKHRPLDRETVGETIIDKPAEDYREIVQPLVDSTRENSSTASSGDEDDDDDFLSGLASELMDSSNGN